MYTIKVCIECIKFCRNMGSSASLSLEFDHAILPLLEKDGLFGNACILFFLHCSPTSKLLIVS